MINAHRGDVIGLKTNGRTDQPKADVLAVRFTLCERYGFLLGDTQRQECLRVSQSNHTGAWGQFRGGRE